MLDKFIALLGVLLILFFVFAGGTVLFVAMSKWYNLQVETQFIANSMAQYGGYTQMAEQSLQDFCNKMQFDRNQMTVTINPPSPPSPYGTVVTVAMSYPFNKTLNFMGGMSNVFTFPLTTYAPGISKFIQSSNAGSPVLPTYVSP